MEGLELRAKHGESVKLCDTTEYFILEIEDIPGSLTAFLTLKQVLEIKTWLDELISEDSMSEPPFMSDEEFNDIPF